MIPQLKEQELVSTWEPQSPAGRLLVLSCASGQRLHWWACSPPTTKAPSMSGNTGVCLLSRERRTCLCPRDLSQGVWSTASSSPIRHHPGRTVTCPATWKGKGSPRCSCSRGAEGVVVPSLRARWACTKACILRHLHHSWQSEKLLGWQILLCPRWKGSWEGKDQAFLMYLSSCLHSLPPDPCAWDCQQLFLKSLLSESISFDRTLKQQRFCLNTNSEQRKSLNM